MYDGQLTLIEEDYGDDARRIGNSPNILRALEVCRELGMSTIGLTGGSGGDMPAYVDHCLCVAATNVTPRIQETHILIGHVICELVDHILYGKGLA